MKALSALAACFFLTSPVRAAAPLPAPQYAVTDLGLEPQWDVADYKKSAGIMLGGYLLHIGPQGQVGGAISQYADEKHPTHLVFRWARGHVISTRTRPIVSTSDGYQRRSSAVTALNSEGVAVLSLPVWHKSLPSSRAYLWNEGRPQSLGTWPNACDITAESVNERGDITCTVGLGPLASRAFVWRNGRRQILPMPPYFPYMGGFRANSRGDLAATAQRMNDSEGFQNEVVLYHNGQMQQVGDVPGHPTASAIAINSGGEVLASAINYVPAEGTPPLVEQDFLWTHGHWQALGTKPGGQLTRRYGSVDSTVTAMNAARQIVGRYGRYQDPDQRAFLYQDGKRQDLNALVPTSSGWKLIEACDINDAGQIVGYGKHDGKDRLFLLNPATNPKQ